MHAFATLLGRSALATKEFRYSTTPEDGQYVRIVGRKSGLADWLLSRIGIDSTTTLEVHRDHIRFTSSNFSGQITTMIPMHSIANTSTGYFKPVFNLIIGALFIFGAMLLPFAADIDGTTTLILVATGMTAIIYYYLHKTLLLSTKDASSFETLLAFKPSVIEGVKIGPEDAANVVAIINKLVLLSHSQPTR